MTYEVPRDNNRVVVISITHPDLLHDMVKTFQAINRQHPPDSTQHMVERILAQSAFDEEIAKQRSNANERVKSTAIIKLGIPVKSQPKCSFMLSSNKNTSSGVVYFDFVAEKESDYHNRDTIDFDSMKPAARK